MRSIQMPVTVMLLLFAIAALPAVEASPGLTGFIAARQAGDADRMAVLRDELAAEAGRSKENFQAQWEAAECFRISATELRTRRQAENLEGKDAKAQKQQQERWSAQGLVYGERALALAKSAQEIAATHRVLGELYANSITGMTSGFKNGPKARTHLDEALARTPDDPECLRAIGLMYLNNPPISGGNIEKAIETFSRCHDLVPANDEYMVMLAMTYQKDKQWERALESVDRALALNPANGSAAALRARIAAREENQE